MSSHTDVRWRVVTRAAVLMAALMVEPASAQEAPVRARAEVPGQAEIRRALDTVRKDPNLATDRTIKTLRWRESTGATPSGPPAWLAWVAGLFRWIDESARLLLWGVVVTLAAFLVVYIARTMRRYRGARDEAVFVAPTHVRDLDIRPESLPNDIGMAARRLWDRSDHRAALALLYRGMLSRLAHIHRVPIRDSSTEGDCLALAAGHLPPAPREYAARLVTVWQRFVYGGLDTPAATAHTLCDDFASALDRALPLDSARPKAAP